jgi:urease accessory protein
MTVVPLQTPIQRTRRHTHTEAARSELAPGAGALQFSKVRGTTVLTRAIAASPLHLLNPRNSGSAAWVYAATYGGGLLGGDAIALDVNVEHGASAMLSTQASTKVYRSDLPASQRLRAHAADDSLLVLLPDPVTPFASSRYAQEQQIELAEGANLIAVDWMTAGRVGSGERWQFTSYASRTWLRRQGRLVLHDATLLTPEDGDVAERLKRFNCLAWAVVIGPAVRAAAVRLAGFLGDAPVQKRADLLLSAAPLDGDGVLLRVAGTSAHQVGAVLKQQLNLVPSLLGDDPWNCKW